MELLIASAWVIGYFVIGFIVALGVSIVPDKDDDYSFIVLCFWLWPLICIAGVGIGLGMGVVYVGYMIHSLGNRIRRR